jgi:hypothetical protein
VNQDASICIRSVRAIALVDFEGGRFFSELRGRVLVSSHGGASGEGETEREDGVLHEPILIKPPSSPTRPNAAIKAEPSGVHTRERFVTARVSKGV